MENFMIFRDVVRGGWVSFSPPGNWGLRKEDRKRKRQFITISPFRFENLPSSLNNRFQLLQQRYICSSEQNSGQIK